MYEDDTGELSAFYTCDRVFAHSELFESQPSLSTFKHWKDILDWFETNLKDRGVERYYAAVDSLEKFRWCEFLGMKSNYETLGDTVEIMVKDI